MNTRHTLLAIALFASVSAEAATFCVADSAALVAALDAADSNSAHDEIRVKTGSFSAPVGGFRYEAALSDADNSLVLSGGWVGAGCIGRDLTPGATVLSGIQQRDVLLVLNLHSVGAAHSITLDHLTLAHGSNLQQSGEGVRPASLEFRQASAQASARIEHCVFRDNASYTSAAGPVVTVTGTLIFRNNLIAGNSSLNGRPAGGFFIAGSAQAYVQNNTVVANAMVGGTLHSGWGFDIFDNASVDLSNNILWGNTGGAAVGGHTVELNPSTYGPDASLSMHYNNIGHVPAAWLPAGHVGTTALDPQFVGGGDWRLSAQSPLIDAGTSLVGASGGLGSSDLDARARVNGAGVDLGAFENQRMIFSHGFD